MISYVNKIFILFLVMLVGSSACRTSKKSREKMYQDVQKEGGLATSMSWMQSVGRDSASRYWMFISDTGFFFHPDEGLWGQSGKLAYIEQKSVDVKQAQFKTSYDSLGFKNSILKSDTQRKSIRYQDSVWWWLVVPLIILGIYGYRRWKQ